MTTFKNNAKYGELMFEYLDLAYQEESPLSVTKVLRTFKWMFKGGSLEEVAAGTRLSPETSCDVYPNGWSHQIAKEWPNGKEARALATILTNRARRRRRRALAASLGTWMFVTSKYGQDIETPVIVSGMPAIYKVFGEVWDWSEGAEQPDEWVTMRNYTREFALGSAVVSHMHVPKAEAVQLEFWKCLEKTRVPGLWMAVMQVKQILREINGRTAKAIARTAGKEEWERWIDHRWEKDIKKAKLKDRGSAIKYIPFELGPRRVRVSQCVLLCSIGRNRVALGLSDVERLHQLLMSATSCLVGCVAQSVVGTPAQRQSAKRVVGVAEANIERIVKSSRLVAHGDEVLVCKGYRRAYTAHLGWLSGPLCQEETEALLKEAEDTAGPGVLDIEGYTRDLRRLDAAGSLNAGKAFKICPAPDVSPGAALMDRVKQIGDCNSFDPEVEEEFTKELKTQILRAYIRTGGPKLNLKPHAARPTWYMDYLAGKNGAVPSAEIDSTLAWEGTAKMPEVSAYDPSHWKDSGIGADTIEEAEWGDLPSYKKNMIMRLLFDDDCPMPGSQKMTDDHVIKFFTKAEGHKDPARGIFSANLLDRQAQSWMEKAVERVACNHPSFMIGASAEVRATRVEELTARPSQPGWVALYYSFDISGWSAKMPAEPQRISHKIWAELYGGHLFSRATKVNEGAYIYLDIDGYTGWYRNTASNLEGFNGKEMTMVLVALLSLSVRVWRREVVAEGVMSQAMADSTVALLFAYIDDGLSRIDLPVAIAARAFEVYKACVVKTFARCGFAVEVSKCFPSDRFAIFLNEVYLAGRHVVHGVRAAMGISAEPTERHTTLVERVTSVATGCRGATMAGLGGFSAVLLLCFHTYQHIREWTTERDPNVLAVWSLAPRAWGGLGLPNMLQMTVSGSGSAFEEGVATLQRYAMISRVAKRFFVSSCRTQLEERTPASMLTAPLSSRVREGYMVDSRVASVVRDALSEKMEDGKVSRYAERLLRYADHKGFKAYAEALMEFGEQDVIQEQMLNNAMEAHPHSIFSQFAKRVEKSMTVASIVGNTKFQNLLKTSRMEVEESIRVFRTKIRDN